MLNPQSLYFPQTYTNGVPYELLAELRQEKGVVWMEEPALGGYPAGSGYWFVLRHGDIQTIMRQPDLFSSWLGGTQTRDPGTAEDLAYVRRMMLNMDPPEHGDYRTLVNKSFTPRAMKSIIDQVDGIATDILDTRMGKGDHEGEIDFVQSVSALLPIWVIAEMLGVPRSDWETLFDWTNRIVGSADPEYQEEGKIKDVLVQ